MFCGFRAGREIKKEIDGSGGQVFFISGNLAVVCVNASDQTHLPCWCSISCPESVRGPAIDYAFMHVLNETWEQVPLPIFAMVVMLDRWHFVVWPSGDDPATEFVHRLTACRRDWTARENAAQVACSFGL